MKSKFNIGDLCQLTSDRRGGWYNYLFEFLSHAIHPINDCCVNYDYSYGPKITTNLDGVECLILDIIEEHKCEHYTLLKMYKILIKNKIWFVDEYCLRI